MINGRKTYDDYFKDRAEKNKTFQNKVNPTSTMFGRNTSGVLATNTDYGKSVYDENLNWGSDINPNDIQGSINEYRSQQQGVLPTIGAGLGRVGTKLTRELIKTAGAIGGTIAGIAGNTQDLITGEDNTDFFATAFDNDFIRSTDKAFDKVNKEVLPVYVSDTVTNGGFFDKITSAEFYATEGADGAGYLLAAFAPGAVIKSLNVGQKLFGAASKLTALRYGKNVETARRALTQAGMTVNKIDGLIVPAANAFFEAGAEAKGAGDSMEFEKPKFIANFMNTFDTNSKEFRDEVLTRLEQVDLDRRSGKITLDEANELTNNMDNIVAGEFAEKEFKAQKGYAMRNTFLTNLAILAGPNYIQSKILYGKNGATNLINQVKKSPIRQGLKRIGETFLTEGGEEVAQTSTEQRQVKKGLANQLHSGDEIYKDVAIGEFATDFIKTLGTTEGQIAGFLGGVLGAPISVVQGYKQDKKDKVESDKLRGKIETTGTSLNDINLPIYKTKTEVNPETGEEFEIFEKDDSGNKIPILENVLKVKEALSKHEEISKMYDLAVESGNIDAVDTIKKYAEHELIMNFINEDEISLDALKEHLKETLPTTSDNKKENNDNLKRQNELIDKARYLQKELVSFQDMSTSIIKLENDNATDEQVRSFMGSLANEFLKETSELYDLRNKLSKSESTKSDLEKQTIITDIDNPLYQEGITNELDKTVKVRSNPRLDVINSKIDEIKKDIKDKESFLNYGIWNSKIVNGAFNESIKQVDKLRENTTPEQTLKFEEIDDQIKNATTTEELDAIDYQNNPVYKKQIAAKKLEIESEEIDARTAFKEEELATKENEKLENQEKLNSVKELTKTNSVGEVVPNPFSDEDKSATIEAITKNSITLRDNETQETSTYTFEEDISDDISADDINVTQYNPVTPGTTHTDHKSVGYDKNNPSFSNYLMEPRDKKGDVVTFELNETTPTDNGIKAIDIVKNNNNLTENRQFLIDNLPITFVYNNGTAKSWSAFKSPNSIQFRSNIIDLLIQGNKLEDLKTTITNQESPSFNTEFENNKPVKNNPLEIDYIKSLDSKNPENKVTLYHVNKEGKLILVSKNKEPLASNITKDLSNEKGQIFLVIKNPKGTNVPVKLNFSRLNEVKASTLAKIYGEILKDQIVRNKNISELENIDEVTKVLNLEIDLLGGNIDTITVNELIESLVHENSDIKAIRFTTDLEGNPLITFNDKFFSENEIDSLGVELQQKYHNVITITTDTVVNKDLNFQNPTYLKYLFDNKIVSTNLSTTGYSFREFTKTGKDLDPKKNVGSELWISSTIQGSTIKDKSSIASTQILTKEELIKSKLQKYDELVLKVLSQRKEGEDTIKHPDYLVDAKGNFIRGDMVTYSDEGIIVDGGLETYATVKDYIRETIEENAENILKSQKKSVPLQEIVKIDNKMDIPGTPESKDYKEAFDKLKVEGEDLIKKEDIIRNLNMAKNNIEEFKDKNPTLVAVYENIVKKAERELLELAETIKCKQV